MSASVLRNIQKTSCVDATFKIPPAYNGIYFAAALKSAQDIGIWFLTDKPVTLSAHHSSITALSFCDLSHGKLLCSCSNDNIILWDLSQYEENEEAFHGTILYPGMNDVSSCCFDYWEYRIALCCDKTILILDVKSREISKELIHTATISGCEFFCKDIMISISSDGLCKVWNIHTGLSPHYKVVGGDPTILAAGHNLLAVVSTTGKIENFQLDSDYRLQHLSIFKVWKLVRDAKKKQEISSQSNNTKEVDAAFHEDSAEVLTLKFLKISTCGEYRKEVHSMSESTLCIPVYLFIVTTTGLLLVNTQNEIVNYYIFKECCIYNSEEFLPAIIRSAVIFATDIEINLILIPLSGCILYNCKININQITSKLEHLNLEETTGNLSFLSVRDVPSGSLLMKELHSKQHKKQGKNSIKSSKMAQPLTFQSQIHSSGYNALPRVETNHNNWEKEPTLIKAVQLSPHSNITAQHVAGGDMVASFGFVDGLIEIAALPHLNIISSLLYHNGSVKSVHFSHSDASKLLLSCGSSDKKLLIWDWKGRRQKPLLIIDSIHSKYQGKPNKNNVQLSEEITAAQFYYLDKFILFSYGNILNMTLYHLDLMTSDIQRYKTNSYYRTVLSIQLEAKRINAIAAINQFYSYLVLCATSSGAINIFDMNTGKIAHQIMEVHSRPVYQIVLNQGSSYINQPSEMHDIYGTAALTDGLKLWDLRTSRCVMYWKEHPNRCHPCNADISACGKYITSGGEDKAIYIYDIRMARIIHRLTGHSDVVSNTNFLPIMSKILATTYDCNAYMYGNNVSEL